MASILDYDNEKISSETKINSTDTSIIYHCNKKNVTCGCGFSDVEITPSRIMTGENAAEASWTMFVSLRISNGTKHICGGTLLSNSFVLTAAHCVNSFSFVEPLDLTVVAGITNQTDSARYVRTIRRIYMHPNFTDQNNRFVNNIALLELDYRLLINSNSELSKTCVHRRNSSMLNNEYLINGTQLIVIGWGINNVELEILQQREAYAIDHDHPICSNLINDVDKQFCTGIYQNQTGSESIL
jgi:secreted trypsin-like serine protease